MAFVPALTCTEIEAALNGRYRNISTVHSGGQGIVFRGSALSSPPSDVALKLYYPTVQGYMERSDREVQALRQVFSPYIVNLHDAGRLLVRGQTCPFVATTFVEGETLSDRLSRGPLDVKTIAEIGHDVALAVDALWTERVVHRDLKPSNIMLTRGDRAIVIDLGVARHLGLDSLTATGLTWGTVGYFSPEQARAWKQLTCKSDLFSLGIVLQQCLLGRHPTRGAQQTLMNGGIPTHQLLPAVPPQLGTVIDSLLRRDPVTRPHPQRVAQDLKNFI